MPRSKSKLKAVTGFLIGAVGLAAAAIGFAADWKSLWNGNDAEESQSTVPTYLSRATSGVVVQGTGNTVQQGTGNINVSGGGIVINPKIDQSKTVNINQVSETHSKADKVLLKRLLGVWDNRYCYPSSSGDIQICLSGRMTYFPNGSYNYTGTMTQSQATQGVPIEYTQSVDATGTWTLKDGFLTMENTAVRSNPQSIKAHDKVIGAEDLADVERYVPQARLPKVEDKMLPRSATQYKLLALSDVQMTAQAFAPNGQTFLVESIKRTHQF